MTMGALKLFVVVQDYTCSQLTHDFSEVLFLLRLFLVQGSRFSFFTLAHGQRILTMVVLYMYVLSIFRFGLVRVT